MRSLIVIFGPAAVGACASDSHGGDGGESYNCAEEDRDDEFVIGLQKNGQAGQLEFRLMSANPAPPARGDNEWILQLNGMGGGAAVAGAQMAVTPFMPDHQHGTPLAVDIEPQATEGQYKLAPVNMWMPGLWEITIEAAAGAQSDTVVYRFCIPS
jgi:hypothetical protein